jgi:hypothetical protein
MIAESPVGELDRRRVSRAAVGNLAVLVGIPGGSAVPGDERGQQGVELVVTVESAVASADDRGLTARHEPRASRARSGLISALRLPLTTSAGTVIERSSSSVRMSGNFGSIR